MANSVWWSSLFGYVMLVGFLLLIPDMKEASRQGWNVFFWALDQRFPAWLKNALAVAIFVSQFLCGLATVTSASRMIFAFARDGGLPGWSLLRTVSPRYRTPNVAIWTASVLAVAFVWGASLVTIGGSTAYSIVVSCTVIFLFFSFAIPIALGMMAYGKTWTKMGPWDPKLPDTLGAFANTITHTWTAHRHRTDTGHDLALGQMPVAHEPLAAVLGQLVSMQTQQSSNLGLDRLRQQRSRAIAQYLGQRIDKSSWLRELENISLGHGVSLLRWRSGGVEHPHDTPPYPFMPSPTFAHSSCFSTRRETWQAYRTPRWWPLSSRSPARNSSSIKPSVSPITSTRSTRHSSGHILRRIRAGPPRSSLSATHKRAGRIRWPRTRTPFESRPEWCRPLIRLASRQMGSCHRVSQLPASFRQTNQAINSLPCKRASSSTSPRLLPHSPVPKALRVRASLRTRSRHAFSSISS